MTSVPRLLTEPQQDLLRDERRVLDDVRRAAERFGAAPDHLAALRASIEQLDELFLVVVVGEFNAGKSALLNALLGEDALLEGVTPTTSRITVVRYADRPAETIADDGVAYVGVPLEILRDLRIVDTPGTNAVLREHEAVTTRFVPRADLVLFVTSADRPFTESERAFLERIRDWGKKVVVVVNKADILRDERERGEVLEFVGRNARALLGSEPSVFAVSARMAKDGGRAGASWQASGVDGVDRFLRETLDEVERVRLKLLNPLGVGQRVVEDVQAAAQARFDVLQDDMRAIDEVERVLEVYAGDLSREFAFRMADVEKLLVEMERRGHDHFDETLRLARVTSLLNKARVQADFERDVISDTPQRIERKVYELVDWLVDADFRQWQAVHDLLAERRVLHRDRLPGAGAGGGFLHDRSRLVDAVARDAQRVVETYDRSREARELAEKARAAVTTSAAIEVGAAGLGATVAAVASTAAADMTGLAMAGVLATLGLLVIPNRRRQAKQDLREKVTAMRAQLGTSLRGAFDDELRRSLERIRQHVEPYSRFVRAEREHLADARRELADASARLESLRTRVARLA